MADPSGEPGSLLFNCKNCEDRRIQYNNRRTSYEMNGQNLVEVADFGIVTQNDQVK